MKIMHVGETIKGGVASVMKQLVIHQTMNNDVEILIPDSQSTELDNLVNCSQYTFRRTGRNISSFLSLFWNFTKLIIRSNPKIVHIHSSFAGVICRSVLILLYPIRRPKVIYCPHAFAFLIPNSRSKKFIYIFIEKFLQCITDKIICTSQYEQAQAIRVKLNRKKLCVIYNGINFSDVIAQSPYTSNKIHLLFVGRFDYQKGYDNLLHLIEMLDPDKFEFTIIGDTVHDKVEIILAKNVKYLGWVKYDKIIPYFQYATVLIMPSRWESFGLVAVEAQSFGLPVIANNCSSLPEVIQNEVTGYLFNFDNELDNVVQILNNKTLSDWGSMKTDCIKFVTSHFSAQSMNKSVDILYSNLMNKSK